MKQKNLLLIIDPQVDFCHPEGALFVKGADKDMERLSKWIDKNSIDIHSIIVTMDTHQINDIAHPKFWKNADGENPKPFTPITSECVKTKKWIPNFEPEWVEKYIETIEKEGMFGHFIWPEHCILGTKGACIDENIMSSMIKWSEKGNQYHIITKGYNPFTEHFGAFSAQVERPEDSTTKFNVDLLNKLSTFDNIYLAGEAKSHCVANTLSQLINFAPNMVKKVILLEDTTSDVEGMSGLGEPIYSKAKNLGMRTMKTTEVIFEEAEV